MSAPFTSPQDSDTDAHGAPLPVADPSDLTLRLGEQGDFDLVRAVLQRAGFDERSVIESKERMLKAGPFEGPADPAGLNEALFSMFIGGRSVARARLEALATADAVAAMERLGLVGPHGDDASLCDPAVVIVPSGGLWFTSDFGPDGSSRRPFRRDYVYSAGSELTAEFVAAVPDMPGARVVELCAGSGVAAIRTVARGAAFAVATDITARSVHFARFNAALNGVADRVRVLESDVWDALEGETFDLVVAHPPYVPALAHIYDFRDAGQDGEQVTRRIIEGLPAHLRPGGRLVMRCGITYRKGATILQRVRGWLGPASEAFDIVHLERSTFTPFEMYRNVTKGVPGYVDCERWLRHFDALEIEGFGIGVFDIRHAAAGRPPITERRTLGARLSAAIGEWQHSWSRFVATAGATPQERMRGVKPSVAAGVRLAVHLEHTTDGWHTVGGLIETAWPTHVTVKTPAFVPTLLELCDGTRGVEELLAGLRSAGLVSDSVSAGDVAQLLETLLAAGALTSAVCPVPPVPGGAP